VIASGALVGASAALALGAAMASGDTTGPPVSTAPPVLTGSPGVGKTLSTTNGSWSTSATFTYQWVSCPATGCSSTPAEIPGATAATYTPVVGDVGQILFARVTATNAAGSASALSSGKGLVEAKPPGVRHKPWIRGAKKVGQTLYESGTRWTRAPYMFRDRWLRCSADGNACLPIRGRQRLCASCAPVEIGVQPDYKVTKKDLGHRLRLRVAAWNGAGRTTSTSNATRIIEN
jgi:hypothetical protein